jgi:CelD/BcsL family acetyltransferase involved in cellulose biosynthesis
MHLNIRWGLEDAIQIKPAYTELYGRCVHPNPYYNPAWYYSWLETLGADKTPVNLCIWDEEGELLFFWPFFECPAVAGKGLWPAIGETADNFAPIIDPTLEADEFEQHLKNLIRLTLEDYQFIWTPLLPESFYNEKLASVLPKISKYNTCASRTCNHQIHREALEPFDDFYKRKISKKSRYNLRRSEKQLRELGEFQHEKITAVDQAMLVFFDLVGVESKSWKGDKGVGIFSKPSWKKFYRKLLPELAETGELTIDLLRIDGKLIAYEFSVQRGAYRALHSQSYLTEYHEYSPGTVLRYYTFKQAFEDGVEILDFMQGPALYKEQYANYTQSLLDFSCFAPNWKGWLNYYFVKYFRKKNESPEVLEES